jgi:hypothetical protein
LALENIALHRQRLEALGAPLPVVICGDSRQFAALISQAQAVVTSPPFAQSDNPGGTRPYDFGPVGGIGTSDDVVPVSPGQLANLREGTLDAALTSPPYANSVNSQNAGGIDWQKARRPDRVGGSPAGVQGDKPQSYGHSPGQLGSLPEGSVAGAITSPPYAEGLGHKGGSRLAQEKRLMNGPGIASYGDTPGQVSQLPAGDVAAVLTSPPFEKQQIGAHFPACGLEPSTARGGQRQACAGQTAADSRTTKLCADGTANEPPDNYWRACAKIYRQVYLALKPGGVFCLVTKSFVRDGAIVDLPADTLTLLVALGFEPLERIRAMLVSDRTHKGLWGEHKESRSRKSFFRRLCEKRGSPAIDFETVLFVRKPT